MTRKEDDEFLDRLLKTYSDEELEESKKAIEQEEAEGIYRYEPSERMEEAMKQLMENLPEIQKKARRKTRFDCVKDAGKLFLKTAACLALIFMFAGAVTRPQAFVASMNKIVMSMRSTICSWMHFTVNENADTLIEKDVSELVIEVGYLPNGCVFESETYDKNKERTLSYAGPLDTRISLFISAMQKSELVIVEGQDCSVFLANGKEVTVVKTTEGNDVYVWTESGYLFTLTVTGYSREEMKKVIVSISIS